MPWVILESHKIQETRKSRFSWMPCGIQNLEIQDFLKAVGNKGNPDMDTVGNPENLENTRNPGFPGYRVRSKKSKKGCRGESRKIQKI